MRPPGSAAIEPSAHEAQIFADAGHGPSTEPARRLYPSGLLPQLNVPNRSSPIMCIPLPARAR